MKTKKKERMLSRMHNNVILGKCKHNKCCAQANVNNFLFSPFIHLNLVFSLAICVLHFKLHTNLRTNMFAIFFSLLPVDKCERLLRFLAEWYNFAFGIAELILIIMIWSKITMCNNNRKKEMKHQCLKLWFCVALR